MKQAVTLLTQSNIPSQFGRKNTLLTGHQIGAKAVKLPVS